MLMMSDILIHLFLKLWIVLIGRHLEIQNGRHGKMYFDPYLGLQALLKLQISDNTHAYDVRHSNTSFSEIVDHFDRPPS